MGEGTDKRDSLRLLQGIENGNLSTADAYNIADQLDPVIVCFILRYLREKYPATQPAAAGVTRRLVELTGTYDSIVKAAKKGEKDSITEWFDDTLEVHDFFDKPGELLELIIEKIES